MASLAFDYTWAIVELMGRQVIAGEVTEITIGGATMLRVDVPAVGDQPAYTKFFSIAAVYAITPTNESTAFTALAHAGARPVDRWIVPDRPALTLHDLPPDTDTDPDHKPAADPDEWRNP